MATETSQPSDLYFHQLDDYAWAEDSEFQAGLKAILGPDPDRLDRGQLEDLSLRARCFYFSRKRNIQVDFDSYKAWRLNRGNDPSGPVPTYQSVHATNGAPSAEEPPASLSFAEVMDLVQNDKPVPGVQQVSDTVLEGQATEATKPERKKPWEQAKTSGQSAGTGLFPSPS